MLDDQHNNTRKQLLTKTKKIDSTIIEIFYQKATVQISKVTHK